MKFKLVKMLNDSTINSFILEKEDDDVITENQNNLLEYSTSREWQHTSDSTSFAIIGSRDKDTGEDHWDKLYNNFSQKCLKDKSYSEHGLTYRFKEGRYTYKYGPFKGQIVAEYSLQIFNITIEDALSLAKDVNQETIIWKDVNFFGFIDVVSGKKLSEFKNGDLGIDSNNTLGYSSKETNKKHSNYTTTKGRRYYYKNK